MECAPAFHGIEFLRFNQGIAVGIDIADTITAKAK
jgi:hypothetical protein